MADSKEKCNAENLLGVKGKLRISEPECYGNRVSEVLTHTRKSPNAQLK